MTTLADFTVDTKRKDWWGELRKYQREAALWLHDKPEGIRGRLLADPMGFGKRLWVETPIPTPKGWTVMGALKRGDTVFDERGMPCRVLRALRAQEAPESMKVTFSDGSVIYADAEHLWFTYTKNARDTLHTGGSGKDDGKRKAGGRIADTTPKVRTTSEIASSLRVHSNQQLNHSVKLCEPVQCPLADLPLHPYVFGVWLGDGHTRAAKLTIGVKDREVLDEFTRLGHPPTRVRQKGGALEVEVPSLKEPLRGMGFLAAKARVWAPKSVPPIYLRSSVEQRQALLEGLMDTDGTAAKNGSCCFDNTNENIADAVFDLVQGLGAKAGRLVKRPTITGRPQAVCAPCHRITFTPNFFVFRLTRKAGRQNTTKRRLTQQWRYITNVEPVAPMRMRCIEVDSPSHLYLAGRSYIATHNTRSLISAVRMRRELGAEDPCTPVITSAISRGDWRREIKRVWPEAAVHIFHMDEPKGRRKAESPEQFHERQRQMWLPVLRGETGAPHNFVIVAYESIATLQQAAKEENVVFDACVPDEAHQVKRSTAQRSIDLMPLVSRSNTTLLATGTPVHNRPRDLFNLLNICKVNYHGGSLYKWAEKYFVCRQTEGGYGRTIDELYDKPQLIHDLKFFMLQRSVAEAYGELPPVTRSMKRLDAPETFRISPAKALKMKDGGIIDTALRKCAAQKLDYAAQLAFDIGAPVVIFTYLKEHANALVKKLEKLKVQAVLATGDVSPTQRDKRIEEWKAAPPGHLHALVCTMDAVRESATLTRAADTIFLDIDWLPGKQAQCEGRTSPARQKEGERRPVRYWYLVIEGGPDEVVAERCFEKLSQADGLPGSSEDARSYAQMLKQVAKVSDAVESPEQAVASLVVRLEARAARLEEVGLWADDDE